MIDRVLDLPPDFLDNPTMLSVYKLRTWMLWPSDEAKREGAYSSFRIRHQIAEKSLPLPTTHEKLGALVAILDNLPRPSELKIIWDKEVSYGVRAGMTLIDVISADAAAPRTATLKKMKLTFEAMSKQNPLRCTVQKFNDDVWPVYKRVSHLWAAALLMNGNVPFWPEHRLPCVPGRVGEFLGNAEALRLRAERVHIRQSAKGPFLGEGVAFSVPPCLALPRAKFKKVNKELFLMPEDHS